MESNYTFTDRERDVLYLVACGLSNKSIAEELCISVHTVKAHVASMLIKANLNSRVALAVNAYKLGILHD